MLEGIWLNKALSRGVINAMWVSLIKWHGDKLAGSSEDPCLRIPPPSFLRMSRPPPLVMWPHTAAFTAPSTLIPLCVFPQISRGVWYEGMCPLPWRRRRRRRRVCLLPLWLHQAWFPWSLASEKRRPESWKRTQDCTSAASFPPDLHASSCVTFPCSR